jgi:class 3 adenylate cyclase/tetratricopeptide (TPR) repeat protein
MAETNIPSEIKKLRPYLPPHLANRLTKDISFDEVLVIAEHIASLRNVLSTYLPRYLVELITEDPTPGQVSGNFRHGAVMFADVSGFTAMSEKLSALGKEGAEEITSVLDQYFDAMLEIGDYFGGDLLKFGGDALLIFFEGDDGPHHALATASLMQESMDQFAQVKTSQGVYPLRMSIGIASGSVFLASLGSPGNMYYAVMGHTLASMAQAEARASAGQIVVDQTTRDAADEIATFVLANDDFWLLERMISSEVQAKELIRVSKSTLYDAETNADVLVQSSLSQWAIIEGLCSYVPNELMARLVVEPKRPIIHGSHRPVTVIFANYQGIDKLINDLGPDNKQLISDILNTYLLSQSRILARYGGTISRLDPYIVGHRIMALFGALRAHEDDPQRAVHAAFEMNQALEAVNQEVCDALANVPNLRSESDPAPLRQRIGINTGFVFAGNVGTATRREYTVMGDQVNVTARLMSLAKEGEVLIGQSTARHAEGRFKLEEKDAVEVKGISEPVRNFVVLGLEERPQEWAQLASIPFVGRERELIQGRQAVEDSLRGDGGVLVIKGASGIGKTRLAEEITSFGDMEGMDLLVGSCLSYGKTMTYHPWAEILRAHFGILVTDATRSRMEALQSGMRAIDEVEWTPVIGTVIGLDIPDNDMTRDLDAKLRRQRFLDLSVKLLQTRAQNRPLMVVVDDAQWADPASMDLISYVARNIAGHSILLILAHRPDEDLPDWSDYPHAIELELGDLPQNACMEIVQSMIGPITLPDSMCQLIQSRGSGNPFFLAEVVRALIDASAVEQDKSGSWQVVKDVSAVELPDTIHGIIISRLDRLQMIERRLLQVASVVGSIFGYETVTGVYAFEESGEVLQDRFDHLQNLGLIALQDADRQTYRFPHLTTQEVVYESLSFDLRRGLHCTIGDYVESAFTQFLGEKLELLAYHYYQGHAWSKAMTYNLHAGLNAQREFANESAIESCLRSLEAVEKLGTDLDTSEEQLAAQETLGDVQTIMGKYDTALGHFGSARNLVDDAVLAEDKPYYLADLYRKTAAVYERQSEFDIAFNWLKQGLEYVEGEGPSVEMAQIYLLGTGIYRRQGKNKEAEQWCHKSLEISSSIGTREAKIVEAQAYYNLGGIQYIYGEFDRSVDNCRKSLDIYLEIDYLIGQAKAYNNLGSAHQALGQWDLADEMFQAGLSINRKIGEVQEQGFITNNLGNIYLMRGDWDHAAELIIESNDIWNRLGASLPDAVTMSNLAQVYICQQNWDAALNALNKSQRIFDQVGSEDFIPELERRWGEYFHGIDDLEKAAEHTQHSIELASAQEARLELGMSFRVMGEIHLSFGDYEAAEITLMRSYRILNDLESEYEAAKSTVDLAKLALRKKEEIDRSQLHQAEQIFQRLGAEADLKIANELMKT